MRRRNTNLLFAMYLIVGSSILLIAPTFATDGNVTQVESFIRSIIQPPNIKTIVDK